MVSIRRRKRVKADKFVVDYRDGAGVRRLITCDTRTDAEHVAGEKMLEAGQATNAPAVDANITIEQYAKHWQRALVANVKPATYRQYVSALRVHLVPALGWMRVRQLQQARIKTLIADKVAAGLAVNTVRLIASTLGSLLSAAVDDGILRVNPMAGVRRKLRILRRPERGAGEPAKAMSAEQLAAFLETARTRRPAFYALALLLARSGLRLGEALALRWTDIDLVSRTIRVERTLGHTVKGYPTTGPPIGTPKSGRARTVDMSQALCRVLTALLREHRAGALRRGEGQALGWLFPAPSGRLQRDGEVRDEFARVVRWAGLPGHFTPHSLRHTFAVQLIQRNAPLPYVQAQLGHASIQMTVDVYGRWLPTGNRALVDQLDAEQPAQQAAESRAVAAGRGDRNATISTEPEIPRPEVIAFIGTSATPPAAACITPD
jgi:integrase